MLNEIEIVWRLLLATVLGGVVGYEREVFRKPAGIRTNMLVCLGSALIMVYAENAFGGVDMSARVAAGIITGVGFLGAGTIIQSRKRIMGLTTAASMWIVASIGMAVGGGHEFPAIVATVLVVLILYFSRVERKVSDGINTINERKTKLGKKVKGGIYSLRKRKSKKVE